MNGFVVVDNMDMLPTSQFFIYNSGDVNRVICTVTYLKYGYVCLSLSSGCSIEIINRHYQCNNNNSNGRKFTKFSIVQRGIIVLLYPIKINQFASLNIIVLIIHATDSILIWLERTHTFKRTCS